MHSGLALNDCYNSIMQFFPHLFAAPFFNSATESALASVAVTLVCDYYTVLPAGFTRHMCAAYEVSVFLVMHSANADCDSVHLLSNLEVSCTQMNDAGLQKLIRCSF